MLIEPVGWLRLPQWTHRSARICQPWVVLHRHTRRIEPRRVDQHVVVREYHHIAARLLQTGVQSDRLSLFGLEEVEKWHRERRRLGLDDVARIVTGVVVDDDDI